MQFNKNTLIYNKDVISIMEAINDNQFNFVYLDVPWFTGKDDFIYSLETVKEDSNLEIKRYLAQLKKCKERDISIEEIKEESLNRRALRQKNELDLYGAFIAKILENALRILDNFGILVFKAPINSVIDYKLMLDQVFSNSYVMQITLEKRKRPMLIKAPAINHELLYFYSKSNDYTLNKVYEKFESYKEQYNLKDEKDRYRLDPLMRVFPIDSRGRFDFTWRGIRPNGNLKWRYNQDKLNELFKDNRIVIKGENAYLKSYLKENPREKSSVWKANWSSFFNIKEKCSFTLMAENFIDLVNMVTNENDWIFAPYDPDQKLPVVAQNLKRNWVTINPFSKEVENYREFLKDYDEVSEIKGNTAVIEYKNLLKNIEDINDIKSRLITLNTSVVDIKNQLNLEGINEEAITEKIQEKINQLIEKSDIEYYIPLVQDWIKPYWDKLEDESKRFLPTAELLFQEYKETSDFDLSTAIMPYCKTLEKELFTKMFSGYIKYLILCGTNVQTKFKKDFNEIQTKRFAVALKRFTTELKNDETEWRFELGTMEYVLKRVFKDASSLLREGRIYRDFKNYLEKHFEDSIFNNDFLLKLDIVVKLRNDSAHPNIVTPERIKEGKEITKQKIIELLKYYNG